jgi:Beta-propeller repeat
MKTFSRPLVHLAPQLLVAHSLLQKAEEARFTWIASGHQGERCMISRLFCSFGVLLFVGSSVVNAQNYGKLPLRFEENRGQFNQQVKFQARGDGYQIFFTSDGATLALHKETKYSPRSASYRSPRPQDQLADVVGLSFVGANPNATPTGVGELAGMSSYLVGRDKSKWLTGLRNYRQVRYESLYPATDLVFYGHGRQLEFDFVLAPGADPNHIKIKLTAAKSLNLDRQGNLVLHTSDNNLMLRAPLAYQQWEGNRTLISANYLLYKTGELGIQVGAYDASKPLVIDPVLSYSTYLGGSSTDIVLNVAADRYGFAYATGNTCSVDFPTTNPFQSQNVGGGCIAFVSKFSQSGSELVYSTYLGGSDGSESDGLGVAVDQNFNAYLTGVTFSPDFPLENPFQDQNKGGAEAFVAELNPTGTALVYSSFLGGSGDDFGLDIVVDPEGVAYVTGDTSSPDFPVHNALQSSFKGGPSDAFVAKIRPQGSGLAFATYVGGTDEDHGFGIALDPARNIYVAGYSNSTDFPTTPHALQTGSAGGFDSVVFKLRNDGQKLLYSTYFGGNADDQGLDIGVDLFGSAHISGSTCSTDFPTRNPAQPAPTGQCAGYAARLDPSGSHLIYSTYLGGSFNDFARGIATRTLAGPWVFDYVSGLTCSSNFPLFHAIQPNFGGICDAFVTKLGPTGAIVYSTYLGGSDFDQSHGIAVDGRGNAYVGGITCSTDFPVSENAVQRAQAGNCDGFVAKIADGNPD